MTTLFRSTRTNLNNHTGNDRKAGKTDPYPSDTGASGG